MSDKVEFRSYEDLERYLRSWGSFRDPWVYDFAGMVHLFRACLDNLIEHHPQHDFADLAECLTEEQLLFLKELVDASPPAQT